MRQRKLCPRGLNNLYSVAMLRVLYPFNLKTTSPILESYRMSRRPMKSQVHRTRVRSHLVFTYPTGLPPSITIWEFPLPSSRSLGMGPAIQGGHCTVFAYCEELHGYPCTPASRCATQRPVRPTPRNSHLEWNADKWLQLNVSSGNPWRVWPACCLDSSIHPSSRHSQRPDDSNWCLNF